MQSVRVSNSLSKSSKDCSVREQHEKFLLILDKTELRVPFGKPGFCLIEPNDSFLYLTRIRNELEGQK